MLLLMVGASWRWKWLGGVVFSALAVLYAALAWRHGDWLLVISVPLLMVDLLCIVTWTGDSLIRLSADGTGCRRRSWHDGA